MGMIDPFGQICHSYLFPTAVLGIHSGNNGGKVRLTAEHTPFTNLVYKF
jgi:hypothetical protein